MTAIWKGRLYTILGAASWGLSGVCGQYLMQTVQIPARIVVSIRMLLAGLIMTTYLLARQRPQLKALSQDKRSLVQLVIFALFGIVLCQLTYLEAIGASNAGTATVLQYTSPILVIAYVSLKTRQAPTGQLLVAIALAILGTALIATHGDMTSLSLTPAGLSWGLVAAVGYALYTVLPADLLQRHNATLVTGLGLLLGGASLFLANQTWTYPIDWQPLTILAMAGLVVVGTLLAYTLFLKGVALVGPMEASLLGASEPISAVFFAFLLMSEHFYLIDLLGMVLIIAAVVWVSLHPKAAPHPVNN